MKASFLCPVSPPLSPRTHSLEVRYPSAVGLHVVEITVEVVRVLPQNQ